MAVATREPVLDAAADDEERAALHEVTLDAYDPTLLPDFDVLQDHHLLVYHFRLKQKYGTFVRSRG